MNFLYVASSKRNPNVRSRFATSYICGNSSNLCERSKYLNERFGEDNNNNATVYKVEYSVIDQAIHSDHFKLYANSSNVSDLLGRYPAVNLSSIDVGEMWILLRLLAKNELQGIEFFYLTPDSYGGAGVGKLVERKEVSISGGRWLGLPGLTTPWNIDGINFRQFSFLGFDVHRLGSIDSYEGFPDNLNRTYILADPPTAPYWLERSMRDNYELISDVFYDSKASKPIERIPGMCPSAVNSKLRHMRSMAVSTQRWCMLPLGPKIQTLGIIIFTSNQLEIDNVASREPTVGILYDFPKPNAEITSISNSPAYYWTFRVENHNSN